MKPLIVLITVFVTSIIILKISSGDVNLQLAARIAMATMLCFTAIGHFKYAPGMALMIPSIVPFKNELILLTGLFEMLAAIGLLLNPFQTPTAWLLIIFLLLVLPANINAAMKHVNYQKASYQGNGVVYLWLRIPLQLFFILWVYFSAIKF